MWRIGEDAQELSKDRHRWGMSESKRRSDAQRFQTNCLLVSAAVVKSNE